VRRDQVGVKSTLLLNALVVYYALWRTVMYLSVMLQWLIQISLHKILEEVVMEKHFVVEVGSIYGGGLPILCEEGVPK